MPEIDVFVPKEKEEEYLAQHHLQRTQLSNGAIILTGLREVDDAADTDLELEFPRGSVYDPAGKRGFVHLFEHFIGNNPLKIARENENGFNATTSAIALNISLNGIANPNVRRYGVWPVLPAIFHELTNIKEVDQGRLTSEQNVVLEEKGRDLGNPEIHAIEHLLQVIYGPANPLGFLKKADQSQVVNTTLEDVRLNSGRILHPKGLVARIMVEGPKSIRDLLTDEFVENFELLSDSDEPLSGYDLSAFSETNPNTRPGQSHFRDSGIRNGLIIAHYAWAAEVKPYTLQSFARRGYFDDFEKRAFQYLRTNGLSYESRSVVIIPGGVGLTRVNAIKVVMQKTNSWEEKVRGIGNAMRDKVLNGTTIEDLSKSLRTDQLRTAALPISINRRLNDCYDSVRRYDGKLVSSDQTDEIWRSLTLDDLKNVHQWFSDTAPVVVVTGNLG